MSGVHETFVTDLCSFLHISTSISDSYFLMRGLHHVVWTWYFCSGKIIDCDEARRKLNQEESTMNTHTLSFTPSETLFPFPLPTQSAGLRHFASFSQFLSFSGHVSFL